MLLSFTSNKGSSTPSPSLTSSPFTLLSSSPASTGQLQDRTYVTTMVNETQLPALVTLAYSLMACESQYGLLVLLPTGGIGPSKTGHKKRKTNAKSRTGRKSNTNNQQYEKSTLITRWEKKKRQQQQQQHGLQPPPTIGDEASASSSLDEPTEWSEDTLAILRAIPNLTIQELSHIQFPPPSSSSAAFVDAVSTLLMFEVWRLTSYKQVLFLAPDTVVQQNIDHLLRTDMEQMIDESHYNLNTSHPDFDTSDVVQFRRRAIDVAIERWLHYDSLKQQFDLHRPMNDYSVTHLSPVEWYESHAAQTPTYLQIVAPMHLTTQDCQRHDEIVQFAATTTAIATKKHNRQNESEARINHANPTNLFTSSLEWSLFSGHIILLQPHSFTYHLLLSQYTHTNPHPEQANPIASSPSVGSSSSDPAVRRLKYGSSSVEFLNRFFQEPCAHSTLDPAHYHGDETTSSTLESAPSTPSHPHPLVESKVGCWHPLPFNYSRTSHTCRCEDSAGGESENGERIDVLSSSSSSSSPPSTSTSTRHSLLTYTCSPTPVWSTLLASTSEILRRYDRLTVPPTSEEESDSEKEDEKSDEKTQTIKTMSTPSTTSPSSSPSYYSQLLSTLAWLDSSDRVDGESHRFGRMYLQEMEDHAIKQIHHWGRVKKKARSEKGTQSSSSYHPPSSSHPHPHPHSHSHPPPGQLPSSCCRRKYIRVIRTYFDALRVIRPNFDGSKKEKRKE